MNFEQIKKEYETTKTSFKMLSEKYKINYKQIERESKKSNWRKFIETPISMQEVQEVQEVQDARAELEPYIQNVEDKILIESFLLSYQLFISYRKILDFPKIDETATEILKQLQIQQKNLVELRLSIKMLKDRRKKN